MPWTEIELPSFREIEIDGHRVVRLSIYDMTPDVLTALKTVVMELERELTGEVKPHFGFRPGQALMLPD